jgi:hypothetical protein
MMKSSETGARRINIYLWETLVLDVCYSIVIISVLCLSTFITVCIVLDTKFVNKNDSKCSNYTVKNSLRFILCFWNLKSYELAAYMQLYLS